MPALSYVLTGNGPSDQSLLAVIDWVLTQHTPRAFAGTYADFAFVRPRPASLRDRINAALAYYPSDLIFVHRDAEAEPLATRVAEIDAASAGIATPIAKVVPVRMTEAWLLHDEQAIRHAAGNPRGTMRLDLPRLQAIERTADPKTVLYTALRRASGLHGRRLSRLHSRHPRNRVSELINDYAPLRGLTAFRAFEAEVRHALTVVP